MPKDSRHKARVKPHGHKPHSKGKAKLKPVLVKVPGKAATPGVRENQRNPFLSADDIWNMGEEQQSWADETSDLQRTADERKAELPQALDAIRRQAMDVREQQASNAVERGIFQSSINEMALTDINVAETVSSEAAKSLVANAQADLDRTKHDIEAVRKPRLYVRAGQRSRENAEAWNANQEYSVDPTAATPGKTVKDWDPQTPGVQTHSQGVRNAAKRAQQPTKPGGGRRSQRPQPRRPGGPRRATVRHTKPKPRQDTLTQRR